MRSFLYNLHLWAVLYSLLINFVVSEQKNSSTTTTTIGVPVPPPEFPYPALISTRQQPISSTTFTPDTATTTTSRPYSTTTPLPPPTTPTPPPTTPPPPPTTPTPPPTTPTPHPTTSPPPTPYGGKIWALLVAGSSGFYNYRHQADLCHAYQIIHENGIPDENIIVMMYDDIAYSTDNPKHGVIINKPGGPNVYKNVLKDYTGEDVNSKNFLHILSGNKAALQGIGSEKVIESGPNDYVFVNFVDHGGPGALMFPGDELLADDLISTLKEMADEKKFYKMVLYIEACYSGSMFDTLLPDNLDIFVTTAADPHESSYACYYDDEIGTYLGDVFSVNWMEDSENEALSDESLNHQFEIVRTETKTSHVEEYGDLDIGSTKLSKVIGKNNRKSNASSISWDRISKHSDAVVSYDVPVATLKKKLELTKGKYERQDLKLQLHHIYKKRKTVDKLFKDLIANVAGGNSSREDAITNLMGSLDNENFPCYRSLFTYFSERCFRIAKNPYVAVHLQKFVNFCSLPWTREPTMINAIDKECSGWQKQFVGVHSII